MGAPAPILVSCEFTIYAHFYAAVNISKSAGTITGESCAIWDFSTPQMEAASLSNFVKSEMSAHSLNPRDFVLLVRQKASEYADVLGPPFTAAGIPLRNEAGFVGTVMLQDLLVEPASELIIKFLRFAMLSRSGRFWTECQELLSILHGVSYEDDLARTKLARTLDSFARELRSAHPIPPKSEDSARLVVDTIVDFVGQKRLVAAYSAYGQGDWLSNVLDSTVEHLFASSSAEDHWRSALDAYEGTHTVPLMTIHKSKGLEYHSVIFIGLDDGAWWSFSNDQVEATAGFFVAFTRAKQRVVFTYCAQRGTRTGIAALYALLTKAGVQSTNVA